jgi:hypothetical protein
MDLEVKPRFEWQRFWIPRTGSIDLSDGGFLSDPTDLFVRSALDRARRRLLHSRQINSRTLSRPPTEFWITCSSESLLSSIGQSQRTQRFVATITQPPLRRSRAAPCPRLRRGSLNALCDLRNGRAATAGHALDFPPRLLRGEQAPDRRVALHILRTSLVATFSLRFRLALRALPHQ